MGVFWVLTTIEGRKGGNVGFPLRTTHSSLLALKDDLRASGAIYGHKVNADGSDASETVLTAQGIKMMQPFIPKGMKEGNDNA